MSYLEILAAQPVPQAVGWALVHFVWQGTLLGLGLFLLLRMGRNWTPEARYLVSCAALVGLLALPVVTAARLGAGPSGGAGAGEGLESRVAALEAAPAAAAPTAPAQPGMAGRLAALVRPVLPWLMAAWGLGVLGLALRRLGDRLWALQVRRRGTRPGPGLEDLLARLVERAGLHRRVALLLTERVPGPAVLGWIAPVILLPPALLLHLTPWQLEMLLAHELAHIRRHDYLVNLLQSLAETLLFFHPAVWWVSSQVRIEREHACDRYAVRLTGDAVGYARALTDVAAAGMGLGRGPALALAGAGGVTLMERIERILRPPAAGPARRPAFATLVSLAGLATFFVLGQNAIAQDAPPRPDRRAQQVEVLERTNALRGRAVA